MMIEKADIHSAAEPPVVLCGTARSAKAGAMFLSDEGSRMYVEGMDEWPDDLLGKRVKLTGVVSKKKIFPIASENPQPLRQTMAGIPQVITLSKPIERLRS